VHQFIASEVRWGGVTVRQETAFPAQAATRLTIRLDRPQTFTLSIRKPGWAGKGFGISINGELQTREKTDNGYQDFLREWKDGDCVDVQLPMTLAVERLPRSEHFAALRHGPILLAGKLGRAGMSDDDFRCQAAAKDKVQAWPETTVFLAASPEDILARIEPVPGRPLEFRTKGLAHPAEVTLAPFGDFHDERYTVYWPVFADEVAWKRYAAELDPYRALRARLAEGSVDFVLPGDPDLERAHKQHGERSNTGVFKDRPWRDASDGWFDYARMKVQPGVANKLVVTYWGSDGGGREFDVIVNGKVIATQKLENNKPDEFFDVEYPIPAALIAGKETVALKFQAHPGRRAGGVFGVRVAAGP
jgi:hypothetical protein